MCVCVCARALWSNGIQQVTSDIQAEIIITGNRVIYEGWNFNSGNYLFTTDTK